jgi:hypothetical protein
MAMDFMLILEYMFIERSLVKVEKNNKLQMHDLLPDMGREIVVVSSAKEPAKSYNYCYNTLFRMTLI